MGLNRDRDYYFDDTDPPASAIGLPADVAAELVTWGGRRGGRESPADVLAFETRWPSTHLRAEERRDLDGTLIAVIWMNRGPRDSFDLPGYLASVGGVRTSVYVQRSGAPG